MAGHQRIGGQAKRALKALGAPALRALRPARVDLPAARWGLAVNTAGHLAFERLDLHELVQRWGSPLHVVRAAALLENARAFAASAFPTRPGCEIFYSYKTNPLPGVLRLLHAQGVGAEAISPFELWLAKRLGVPPEKTIYNGPAKTAAALAEAIADGLALINLNSREEVPLVAQVARQVGRRARVGLRVTTGVGWSAQFGLSIASGEAFRGYQEAVRSTELEVVGLHAHVGSLIRQRRFLAEFVSEVLAFADQLRDRLGLELSILDLGGSLAVPTVAPLDALSSRLNRTSLCDLLPPDPGETLAIADYLGALQAQVAAHYLGAGRRPPRIFLEPGRALTGNAQFLLSTVQAVRASPSPPSYAILDAGINLADSARFEFHQLFSVNKHRQPHQRHYRLVGPICSPGDVLCSGWRLPKLEPGDSLALMDSGAYFIPSETSFSFPRPAVVLVERGEPSLLRRPETFEDLVARDALGVAGLEAVGSPA